MSKQMKVIADYPNSPFRIGDILELEVGEKEIWVLQRTGYHYEIDIKHYPKIFQEIKAKEICYDLV